MLGVNPFNQPDVEEAKLQARADGGVRGRRGVAAEEPILRGDGLSFFADEKNASALMYAAGTDRSRARLLKAHLKRLGSGIISHCWRMSAHAFNNEQLGTMRRLVRNARRGDVRRFRARYLHSTGQATRAGRTRVCSC